MDQEEDSTQDSKSGDNKEDPALAYSSSEIYLAGATNPPGSCTWPDSGRFILEGCVNKRSNSVDHYDIIGAKSGKGGDEYNSMTDAPNQLAYDFLFSLTHLTDESQSDELANRNLKDPTSTSFTGETHDGSVPKIKNHLVGSLRLGNGKRSQDFGPAKSRASTVSLLNQGDEREVAFCANNHITSGGFFRVLSPAEFKKYRNSVLNSNSVTCEVPGFEDTFVGPRLVLANTQGNPVTISSICKNDKVNAIKYRSRTRLNKKIEAVIKKKRPPISYSRLLVPSRINGHHPHSYSPFALENYGIAEEKKCTVAALPGFIGVTLHESDSNENSKLNTYDKYMGTRININPSLTLSQIRNVKIGLMELGNYLDLDLIVVACAYAYFEKLILERYVNRSNRKVVAGSCLLLSEKVNDCGKEIISKTLELADKYIGAEKHEIKECEFDVYSALEFNLFLPKSDFILHLDRLGDLLNRTSVSSKSSSPSK